METLGRVVASMAEAARTAGVRIVTGDTKVVDRGKGDGMFINTAGVGWVAAGHRDLARPSCARRRRPAQRRSRPARHRDHVGPRGAPVRGHAGERLCPAGRTGRGDARHRRRHPLPPRSDARRTGRGAQRNRHRRPGGHRTGRSGDSRAPSRWPPPASCWASTRSTWPTRAGWWRLCRPPRPRAVLDVMRGHPAAVGPAQIGVVSAAHAGTVELRTRFGGGRVVDLLSGEQMPRIC